ncbi:MAG TPA: anthranilate synthase component I family protein [Gaiellales bacterium]|nr:anthranilate synthase component I family protein [Gaiellales bacterium]
MSPRSLPASWGGGARLVLDPAAHDPFGLLERFLAGHGFAVSPGVEPAGDGRVADLFLGYGLAVGLAGVREPQPPEPCPLPLLWCRVRGAVGEPQRTAGACKVGAWRRTWQPARYVAAVGSVRAAIARGDVYQVNLVQHLSAPFSGDPAAVAAALAGIAGEYARAVHEPAWSVISATPELFLETRGRRVRTMPIKGTRPAGAGPPIAASDKDLAEHVMIVDLERNDLGRVCVPGSVAVTRFLRERPMTGVRHLVSTVEGTLAADVGLAALLAATFPGGSITGAPKIAAIDHIARLEPVGRGASMGALGTVAANGDLDLGLTIRTFAIAAGRIHLWVGGGIVWDSDPAAEVEESLVKARPLLARLASGSPSAGSDPLTSA